MAFQKRPARHVHRQCLGLKCDLARPEYLVAAERQVKLGQLPVVPNGSTVGYQLIEKPGEELIQDLRTARQQNMDMPALRYPSSNSGIVRQHIPLDHSDGPKEISQDPRGKQPAHARAENHRAPTQFWHSKTPESKSDVCHHRPNHSPEGINHSTELADIKTFFASRHRDDGRALQRITSRPRRLRNRDQESRHPPICASWWAGSQTMIKGL